MPACRHLCLSAEVLKIFPWSGDDLLWNGMQFGASIAIEMPHRHCNYNPERIWSQEQYGNWLPYIQRLKNPINHKTVNNLIYYCSWLYENLWFLSRESHLSIGIYSQFMIFISYTMLCASTIRHEHQHL